MAGDNLTFKSQIEASSSDESIEKEVISSLEKADTILNDVEKSGNQELLDTFTKEYNDLQRTIQDSLEENNDITISELTQIRLELSDVENLAKDNDIIKSSGLIERGFGKLIGLNVINTESENITEKDIGEYTEEEALGALNYLNNNYSLITDRVLEFGEDSISSLDSENEVQYFQQELIEKVLGSNKGYNDKYVQGFSEIKGNYLVKIDEGGFINTVNHTELKNYLLYLENKSKFNTDVLLEELGWDSLDLLGKIWDSGKDNDIKEILKRINFSEIVDLITWEEDEQYIEVKKSLSVNNIKNNDIDFFVNYPENISFIEDPEKFIEVFNKLEKDKQNEISLIKINEKLRGSRKIIENLDINNIQIFEFKLIPDEFFTVENSKFLLEKFKFFSYYILPKVLANNDKNNFKKIITDKNDIKNVPEDVQKFLLDDNNKSKTEYEKDIQEETDMPNLIKLLDSYIFIYGITSSIESKLIETIKAGTIPTSMVAIEIDNPKVATEFIKTNKTGITNCLFFSENLRNDKNILNLLINNSKSFKEIQNYVDYIEINSINELLYVYNLIKIKFGKDGNILDIFLNSNIRRKMSSILESNKDALLLSKYKDDFKEIINMVNETNKNPDKLREIKETFKDIDNSQIKEIFLKYKLEKHFESFINGDIGTEIIIYRKIKEKLGEDEIMKFMQELIESRKKYNETLKNNTALEIEKIKLLEEELKLLPEELQKIINEKGAINTKKLEEHFDKFRLNFITKAKQSEDENIRNNTDKETIINSYLELFGELKNKDLKDKIKIFLTSNVNIQEDKVKVEDINKSKETGEKGIYQKALESGNKEDLKALKNLYYEDLKASNEERSKFKARSPDSTLKTKILDEEEYNRTGNGYSFIYNGEEIKITLEEKNLIENSEEAKENLIKTKNILEDLNMGMIWEFRTAIFGVTSGMGFKINDGNYLNENEMKLFLSKIIKSISPELKEAGNNNLPTTNLNLEEYIEGIKRLNKIGPIGGIEEVNILGESYLEKTFIDKFANRYSSISDFDPLKFKQNLNNSSIA